MSEWKDKTPEQVTDEDYKVAPTSADKELIDKTRNRAMVTGENYELTPDNTHRLKGNEKKEPLDD